MPVMHPSNRSPAASALPDDASVAPTATAQRQRWDTPRVELLSNDKTQGGALPANHETEDGVLS